MQIHFFFLVSRWFYWTDTIILYNCTIGSNSIMFHFETYRLFFDHYWKMFFKNIFGAKNGKKELEKNPPIEKKNTCIGGLIYWLHPYLNYFSWSL